MNCQNCRYYTETYKYKGICTLYDNYVKADDSCEDYEEE